MQYINENVNYIIQIGQQIRDMSRQGNDQNISYSQQNILANSIRIARQRISKYGQVPANENQDKDNSSHNQTFSFSKPKKQNSAAMAIKVLHKRISQLQAFNITLTKQNSSIKKQANLKNLQMQSYKSAHQDLEDKLSQYRQNFSRIQKLLKDKQHELAQIKQKQYIKAQKYQQIIMEKTKSLADSQTVIGQLEKKVGELNKRIENNQKIIVQMIKQLQQQKIKSSHNVSYNSPHLISKQGERYKDSKSIKSKDDNFPVIVEQPDNSKDYHIYKIESSRKIKPIRSQPKNKAVTSKNQKNLQLLNKELKQKNQQLYNMLRASDRKFKEEEKQKILCKERFYSLKNATDSIIDQINRLPNNLSHRFKCLVVKVKKIEQDNLECLRSHSSLRRYRNTSNSSKQGSAQSKSRQKQLKMQDLSLTDNQIEARSHSKSKSKRRSTSTFIHSHSGKKPIKISNQQQTNENEVVRLLNKKIREQRKEICELSKKINQQIDSQKIKAINIELQQKINKNQQLIAELESYKKERTNI